MILRSVVAVVLMTASVVASEPFKVDVTQRAFAEGMSSGPDHLLPCNWKNPEFYYLAQYIAMPALARKGDYFSLTKEKTAYVLNVAQIDTKAHLTGPPKPTLSVSISESTAETIYSIWVNATLEVRYNRQAWLGLDGCTYTFSTYVRALGWMHGYTWSPDENTQPGQLVKAAELILRFAKNPDRSEKHLESSLKIIQKQYFDYLLRNGKH